MSHDPRHLAQRHAKEIMAMPPELRDMIVAADIAADLHMLAAMPTECRAMMAQLDAAEALLLPDERAAAAAEFAELRELIRLARARLRRTTAQVRRFAAQILARYPAPSTVSSIGPGAGPIDQR